MNIGQQVDLLLAHLEWWMILLPLPFLAASLLDVTGWRQLLPKEIQVRFTSLLRIHVGSEAVLQSVPGGFALSDALKTFLLKKKFSIVPYETLGSLIIRHWLIGLAQLLYVLFAILLSAVTAQRLGNIFFEQRATFFVSFGVLLGISLILGLIVYKLMHDTLGSTALRLLSRLPFRGFRSWLGARREIFGTADERFDSLGRRSRWTLIVLFVIYSLVWSMETVETLLVAHTVGFPMRFVDAFALEAFLSTLKLAVFFLPSGIGAKELGYFALFSTFGVRATTAQIGLFVILKRIVFFLWVLIGYGILLAQGIRPLSRQLVSKTTVVNTP